MQQENIAQLADWLEAHKDGIADRSTKLDVTEVFAVIDSLAVLNQPVTDYLAMTEDAYDEKESDHKFTLDTGDTILAELKDRILINHVDGVTDEGELNFNYNHEDAFKSGYQVKTDLNILTYGFEVVGAAAILVDPATLKQNLSKDAVVSLGIAANSIDRWQQRKN
ncbi:hypothetical protein FHQ08_02460 [Lactobacillus sp. CC-MHH1034]|uniref:hypothetical protein n=1 Tax=Agrilactobacillus fermenti TaxID=2586909 RepID=UPI001E2F43DA|nr:hypothetical protein [Agrilactobacillus fermenti]MCD2255575.1 hypothetical protein [Agrilactobacillus fermenti]